MGAGMRINSANGHPIYSYEYCKSSERFFFNSSVKCCIWWIYAALQEIGNGLVIEPEGVFRIYLLVYSVQTRISSNVVSRAFKFFFGCFL